jgi:hypothetical protein
MRAHALFGRMSELVDRLNGYRAVVAARGKDLAPDNALRKELDAFSQKVDAVRKEVVATSEGGAITGEERLREHLAYVYDGLLSYEGRPGDYQVERVNVLERELMDVEKRAAALTAKELPPLNEKLKGAGLPEIAQADAVRAGNDLFAARTLERAFDDDEREPVSTTRRRERD